MKYTKIGIIDGKPKLLPYKFPNKKEENEYINICEIIWGCVPFDVDWAIKTKPYIRQKEQNES